MIGHEKSLNISMLGDVTDVTLVLEDNCNKLAPHFGDGQKSINNTLNFVARNKCWLKKFCRAQRTRPDSEFGPIKQDRDFLFECSLIL